MSIDELVSLQLCGCGLHYREMLDNLRESHEDIQNRILQERATLTKERCEIEARLNSLRDELREIHTEFAMVAAAQQHDIDSMGPKPALGGNGQEDDVVWIDEDDEPFEAVVERAQEVQRDIETTLANFHARIVAVGEQRLNCKALCQLYFFMCVWFAILH